MEQEEDGAGEWSRRMELEVQAYHGAGVGSKTTRSKQKGRAETSKNHTSNHQQQPAVTVTTPAVNQHQTSNCTTYQLVLPSYQQ